MVYLRFSGIIYAALVLVPLASPAAAQQGDPCRGKPMPEVGMTEIEIKLGCWGKPKKINSTYTSGHQFDQFVYSNAFYVYLTDGVVTAIQTSRK